MRGLALRMRRYALPVVAAGGAALSVVPDAMAHREKVTRDGVEYTCVTVDVEDAAPPPSPAPSGAEAALRRRPPLCPARHAPLPVPTSYAPKGPPPPMAPATDALDALLSVPNCVQGNPTAGTPAGCYWYIQQIKRYADVAG